MKKIAPSLIIMFAMISMFVFQSGSAQNLQDAMENVRNSNQFVMDFEVEIEPYYSTEEEYWDAYSAFSKIPTTRACKIDLARESERLGRWDVVMITDATFIFDHERKQFISCSLRR